MSSKISATLLLVFLGSMRTQVAILHDLMMRNVTRTAEKPCNIVSTIASLPLHARRIVICHGKKTLLKHVSRIPPRQSPRGHHTRAMESYHSSQLMADLAVVLLLELHICELKGIHRESCDVMNVMQRVVSCRARHAGCFDRSIQDQLILPDRTSISSLTKHSQLAQQETPFSDHHNVYESLSGACLA